MSAQWLVSDIFSKPHRMRQFAPWLKEEDIQLLLRPKGSPFTRSDVPILDEAMDMLGPDPHEAARRAVQDADRRREEEYARQSMQAEIRSEEVGKAILQPLGDLDDVAYLRFASVYKHFDSMADYEAEIDDIRLHKPGEGSVKGQ